MTHRERVRTGLAAALYNEMTKAPDMPLAAGLDSTVHSHVIGFAAEQSRLTGTAVNIEEFQRSYT